MSNTKQADGRNITVTEMLRRFTKANCSGADLEFWEEFMAPFKPDFRGVRVFDLSPEKFKLIRLAWLRHCDDLAGKRTKGTIHLVNLMHKYMRDALTWHLPQIPYSSNPLARVRFLREKSRRNA